MLTQKINWLNILLIILSLAMAFWMPFQLFIYAYAILGPLHYLTEINWLREKKYFVNDNRWLWIVSSFVLFIVVPKYLVQPSISERLGLPVITAVAETFNQWSNGLIFIWLVISASLILLRSNGWRLALFGAGVLGAVLLNTLPSYIFLVGLLLPTVIHVYVFTILFMLYGAIRAKSKAGFAAVILVLICPLVIIFASIHPESYVFPDMIKQIFTDNNFHVTNTKMAQFLGLSDGTHFFFYSTIELKLQIFIAFAYTYHYLNWFSKTGIIGWHKNLSVSRSVVIGIIWILSVCLYGYNYQLGFYVLLSLSFLHLLLEFPLNILSMKGIGSSLWSLVRKNNGV